MANPSHYETIAPRQESLTTWTNPLDAEQHVDVFYGTGGHKNEPSPTRFVFPPGATVDVPSRFDEAIQRVQCAEEECRRHPPGFCKKPGEHVGNVVGGLAPQLRRVGARTILLDALDPKLAEKRQAEAQIAAANIARRHAEDAMLLAESRRIDIDEESKPADADPIVEDRPRRGRPPKGV